MQNSQRAHKSMLPILLIEDNPGDARLVEIFLEEHNIGTTHCTTLEAGIKTMEEGNFSATLLDMHLPDSRGFETLERVLKRFPDSNVIVLTGLADREFGLRAVGLGAQDFLVKGEFSSEQLVKTLDYSIERHKIINRLEEAQRVASLGHFEFNAQSGNFHAAEELYRILGLSNSSNPVSKGELIALVHPEDLPKLQRIADAIQAGQKANDDLRVIRKGKVRHISIYASPMFDQNEGVIGASGVVQDITDRTLRDLAARKDKQRYETIFNQSRDAIFLTDESGHLRAFNKAMVNLFGYQTEELTGMSIFQLFEDRLLAKKLETGLKDRTAVADFEADLLQKNGEVMTCLISANTTILEEVNGFQGTIRNITETKNAQRLQQEKELAERSSKLKEEFLASISHEMRTPLNAVLGISHLMRKTDLNTEQSKYLDTIMTQSDHLLSIINDILQMTNFMRGDYKFKADPFDLHKTFHDLFRVVKIEAGKKGLATHFEIDDQLEVAVKGDLNRFQQILNNLTTNAIKFTNEGQISVRALKIGDTETHTRVRIEVQDTGIGMHEDQIPLIFQNFVRVAQDKEKLYEGVGLGLSIVKSLVERQGGIINVTSEFNHGSTFTVELDFEKGKVFELGKEKVTRNPDQSEKPEDLRILLVEDNKVNQLVAKKTILKEWPEAQLEIANNGQEGVNLVKENDFDLILMDIQMPVMDGVEATAEIRSLAPPKGNIPILAMTAHVNVADTYKKFDMDGCVLKPFKPDDLFGLIKKHARKNTQTDTLTHTDMTANDFKYINLEYLELMADGDQDMKGILLEMLLTEPIQEFQKMRKFLEEKNWDELKQVSHKMKTTLPYIGYQSLIDTNVKIDRLLWERKEKGISDTVIEEKVPQMVEQVIQMYEISRTELKLEFDSL
ncbi:MAG: response regulator [Bacteroidota bacterium]